MPGVNTLACEIDAMVDQVQKQVALRNICVSLVVVCEPATLASLSCLVPMKSFAYLSGALV